MRYILILIILINFTLIEYVKSELSDGLSTSKASTISSKTFNTIDLHNVDSDLHAVKVSIGYPPQKFSLLLDISSEYTWVSGSKCNEYSYSKTFIEKDSETLTLTNETISWNDVNMIKKGEIAYDYVNIKIFSANSMPFIIVGEDYYLEGVDGVIGFGFGGNSEINFSILDKLYENNQIRQRIFTLEYHDVISSSIFIGKLPDHIQHDLSNLTYCHVNTSLHYWNCKISHVLIGDDINFYKAIPVNSPAMFSSTIKDIIVPPENIQFFMQNYFTKYPDYDSKYCYVKPDGKKFSILCNLKYFNINNTPSLSLILNGYAYKIFPQDLFEEIFSDAYNQYYLFKILFTDTPNNQWIVGVNFLKQFEVVFNKETEQVGFYGGVKYDLTKFTGDPTETICLYNYSVYAFIIMFVVMSMGFIIYKKRKENEAALIVPNYKLTPFNAPKTGSIVNKEKLLVI